jgi:hypothetical protein
MLVLLLVSCTKTVPPDAAVAVAVAVDSPPPTPEVGWYDSACYAARDGDVDTALDHLAWAIRRGEAPLDWMGRDPDLTPVRADPRFTSVRDEALDAWIADQPPRTGLDWLRIAHVRRLQGRDVTHAVEQAEAAGVRHPLFGPDLPRVTPALEALDARRDAFVAQRRGSVTVENPLVFELANIVLSQTDYGQSPNATDRDSAYAAAVDAWFAPHRDHPLITELNVLPVDIGVYYAFRNQAAAWDLVDGTLTPGAVYPVGAFWGTDPFASRRAAVQDWIDVTEAADFLAIHADTYAARIAAYEQAVPIRSMWDWLEERFPSEGDGRDALVVRTSPLIGGSHNASTLELGDFTEGTMVVPITVTGDGIAPVDVGPLARMVFTEIDHHYVNPVSDRMRPAIDDALGDWTRFNAQGDEGGYRSAYLTFNEYATWVLFDVWWAEHCAAVTCTAEQHARARQSTVDVMERRAFHRYADFREAMLPVLVGRSDLEAAFPDMLAWFATQDP